ncbi:recombinase family protein [Streptomyces sp. NBC_00047]|uniref:recombinase family protein n=1 Tax=Streptomyces sp. NBC_00047 TaxID=2975627 RepID=UPI002250272F|nr:recombinase family protein [Streptomyces sp. NBC_00047]MCX5612309.1 recombinase family protein [Streptomyces sp. NBC_00047]
MSTFRWEIASNLTKGLAEGGDFAQWLGDRVPVVSYARISRSQGAAAAGRQHLNNLAEADRLGWAVVCLYTDDGVSAANPDIARPAFERMLRDLLLRGTAEGFPISGVISVEQERLARSADDYLRLLRALSIRPEGCLYLGDTNELIEIPAVLKDLEGGAELQGQLETDRIGRRRRRSIRDRAREGLGSGGQRRFGWLGPDTAAGRSTNTVLDSFESTYLREAVDRALAGATWMSIADWLTAERVPTVRGGRWTIPTVQAMLTNPAMCGYRLLDGVLVRDGETGAPVVGGWQAVATPDEWWTLVGRCNRWYSPNGERSGYKDRYPSQSRGNGPGPGRQARLAESELSRKYLLSGFLRCGYTDGEGALCGAKMGGHPPHGTNRYASYRCSSSGCRKVGRRADLLECHVEAFVRERAELTAERWQLLDTKGRRDMIASMVDSIVVRPLPKGRTRNAPFDPALIEVIAKAPAAADPLHRT